MPFYSHSFSYDNVPSEMYGLYISAIDGDAVSSSEGNSNMEILNQKIWRKTRPYFYGATTSDTLKFNISAHSQEELTAVDFGIIQRWLFSSRNYKTLRIFQPDMTDCYFNAIFNSPEIVRIGGKIYGFNAEVECDSPFGYLFPKTTTKTYTAETVDDSTLVVENKSDDGGEYVYPKVLVIMNSFGGDVTITNNSDAYRAFTFTSVSASEQIAVDNYRQIVTSSTGIRRLANFNKKWLRLVPGSNTLRVQGNVATVSITTQFVAKKIGG